MSGIKGLLMELLVKLEKNLAAWEKAGMADLVALYENPRRLLWLNFISGISRGFGIAVGFTLIGAVFLLLLARIAALNLPIIGEFIADIARIVQNELRLSGPP
ncbi:MAG TPA: hypothetical protein GXX29_03065 [Firmicutes bacterium]|nr:hypothetical protein [Bacillota bacterium]